MGEDGPELVAVVMGDLDDDFDPEPARRARLIAAAPELLEALRQLNGNAAIARFLVDDPDGVVVSALWDTIQQADHIIAKATGGSV